MKYKCLIFDFDGTLADTSAGILATFRKTLATLSLPCPADAVITATIGLPLKQNFTVALPGISDSMADQCVITYRSLFDETAIPVISAFPQVRETLEALHDAGLRLFVATSRSHRSLATISGRLGIAALFEGFCTTDDVAHPKPAPDMVNLILQQAGIAPQDALVIGDTTYDLQMGQAAGCAVCGVTWGNHTRERLSEIHPDHIIDRMADIASLCGLQAFSA